MVKCAICDTENPENAVYCSQCGARFGTKQDIVSKLSKVGIYNLGSGIISMAIAIICISFMYGGIWRKVPTSPTELFVITDPEGFISGLFIAIILIFLLGILGGFEVGRYFQMELTKRKLTS